MYMWLRQITQMISNPSNQTSGQEIDLDNGIMVIRPLEGML